MEIIIVVKAIANTPITIKILLYNLSKGIGTIVFLIKFAAKYMPTPSATTAIKAETINKTISYNVLSLRLQRDTVQYKILDFYSLLPVYQWRQSCHHHLHHQVLNR